MSPPYLRSVDSNKGRAPTRGHYGRCPYCARTNVVIWADGEPNHQHRWSWACRSASNRLRPDELAAVERGTRDAKTGRRLAPRRKR